MLTWSLYYSVIMEGEAGFSMSCAHVMTLNVTAGLCLLGKEMCFGVSLSSLTSPVRQKLKEVWEWHRHVGEQVSRIVYGYWGFRHGGQASPKDFEMTVDLR